LHTTHTHLLLLFFCCFTWRRGETEKQKRSDQSSDKQGRNRRGVGLVEARACMVEHCTHCRARKSVAMANREGFGIWRGRRAARQVGEFFAFLPL
jgi:hypothetical protein